MDSRRLRARSDVPLLSSRTPVSPTSPRWPAPDATHLVLLPQSRPVKMHKAIHLPLVLPECSCPPPTGQGLWGQGAPPPLPSDQGLGRWLPSSLGAGAAAKPQNATRAGAPPPAQPLMGSPLPTCPPGADGRPLSGSVPAPPYKQPETHPHPQGVRTAPTTAGRGCARALGPHCPLSNRCPWGCSDPGGVSGPVSIKGSGGHALPRATQPKAHSNILEAKSHALHCTAYTGLRLALPIPHPQTWAGPKGQFHQHPSWPT